MQEAVELFGEDEEGKRVVDYLGTDPGNVEA